MMFERAGVIFVRDLVLNSLVWRVLGAGQRNCMAPIVFSFNLKKINFYLELSQLL